MTSPLRLCEIHRTLPAPCLQDIKGTTREQTRLLLDSAETRPGQSVAVAVGSRGIANLADIVEVMVEEIRQWGLSPFLVPAMGSHGGATAAGQIAMLQKLGIDATRLGVEIRAEMQTRMLGTTFSGLPVHFSQIAAEADHVLLCNRIKPHTNFNGPIQSGLLKMLVIGLGKQTGAAVCHRLAEQIPFEQLILETSRLIQTQISVLGGLAILENAREQTALITAVKASEFSLREPELLQQATRLMPRLPVKQVDLLIIDEIGKEISGTGMDTNVIGRKANDHVSGPDDWCQTRLIYVRGITEASLGNATGIGMAEFTHVRVIDQVDWPKTALNSITAAHPTAAMRPVTLSNDREVLAAVQSMTGDSPRIVHLKNTLQLQRMFVSENCRDEILQSEPAALSENAFELCYDEAGYFTHHFPHSLSGKIR